jgi:hypothetical protein
MCVCVWMYKHADFNNDDNYHRNWDVTGIMIILIYSVNGVIPGRKKHQHLFYILQWMMWSKRKEKLLQQTLRATCRKSNTYIHINVALHSFYSANFTRSLSSVMPLMMMMIDERETHFCHSNSDTVVFRRSRSANCSHPIQSIDQIITAC